MGPGGKLASWKEIASYLDRSVRTVQRWEQELGLPVYRLPGKKRDIVYAIPAEIDAWQEKNSHHLTENGNGALAVPQSSLVRRFAVWGITAAILLIAAAGAWQSQRASSLASWEIKDNRLIVSDKDGRKLWEHAFQAPLDPIQYRNLRNRGFNGPLGRLVDLDQNGEQELLFLVASVGNADPLHGTLLCFDHKGQIRWSYKPNRAMHYGTDVYEPPYVVDSFSVALPSIWITAHHWRDFPSVLARLDGHGKTQSEFWVPGHVMAVAEGNLSGRRLLLLGGTNNENYSASLTVVDYARPTGSAPAENNQYRCEDCPAGAPLAFFLFPRSELSRVMETRPFVSEIIVHGNEGFELVVDDRLREAGLGYEGDSSFSFDAAFHLTKVEIGDSYGYAHNDLQMRGVIKHNMDRRKESQALDAVRYWDGSHFARLLDDSQLLAHLR